MARTLVWFCYLSSEMLCFCMNLCLVYSGAVAIFIMAYIPPHKRHSKDDGKQSPIPELLVPQFRRNVNLRPSVINKDRSGKIIYSNRAISRWFALGLDENDKIPSSVHLKSISMDHLQRNTGEKSLILVNNNLGEG